MRNLKIKSISAPCVTDQSMETVSEKTLSPDISEMFSYPEVWKKAFSLGKNVRFTRTPEVEILRRRIETDPIFAKQFKVFAQQEKQRLASITKFDKKTVNSQLVEKAVNPRSVENKASLYCSTVIRQPVQQIAETSTEGNAEKHASSVKNTVQKIEPVFYLSDNAFFECGPFMLEQAGIKILCEEGTSTDAARSTECQDNEIFQEMYSAFDESITSFYRVLEHRFPRLYDSIAPEASAADIKDAEEICALDHTENNSGREILIRGVESVFEENEEAEKNQESPFIQVPVQGAGNMTEIAINNEDNGVADYAVVDETKGTTDSYAVKEERNAFRAINMPFRSHTPASVPILQSVDYDDYKLPPANLLHEPIFQNDTIISQEMLERSAELLENVLKDFGVKGEITHVRPGPVVTMYEFKPAAGVKSSRVIGLSDDIARSMSAISARVAVIPGHNVIGIELPNAVRKTVYFSELIQSRTFRDSQLKLALALGKGINGEPVTAELAKMPHLLVAGTTGSGKSVAVNTMILSILYRMTPEQCRLIMVDPKMLELSVYDGIPHLLTPVVTDPKKAVTALKWAVREMEERYSKMAKLGVRNIDGFNARIALAVEKGETIMCTVQSGFDKESGEMLYHEEAMNLAQLPYIVIIVDEMADLMMVAGKEIEGTIQRLAQMARAAGIHLIMATQRPSVDVITGTIKANFPTRISFQVTSKIDSRTILGEQGAETLLGQGDMLYMAGGGRIARVHGSFVSDKEIESVVAHLKVQGKPNYLATITDSESDNDDEGIVDSATGIVAAGSSAEENRELYTQAIEIVMRDRKCSTSYIQRRLAIGYNKAASLVERMEEEGIVGAANHVGKREILLDECNDIQGDF
ncbi:cell division protein FtsK [Bartonella australis AUST/NH1]|uniref:Cell division protein FtsK n=1 Tax=Bartonella australis (strain Aust/NH1) TaxID=1094489 RepID=M1P2R2_BARAA|nr:DNA translocase FtsK [Bartonella australis]AGF74100.1 cell division protein FtsK [Bartonella australis AUST/NH1]